MNEKSTRSTPQTTDSFDVRLALWATHKAAHDFKYFLTWVKTKDESEGLEREPFPIHREYLQYVAEELQYGPHKPEYGDKRDPVWVPKSRRLMWTWIMCAYLVWKSIRSGSWHAFLQTNKEEDADFLIEHRVKYVWDNLPYWMRFVIVGGPEGTEGRYIYCKFSLPNGAKVWGVPQGPDVLRQYTPSLVFVDEAAYQPEFGDTLAAIMPFVEKNTEMYFVSSANASVMGDVVTSHPEGEIYEPIMGIKQYRLQQGGRVLETSFTADPEKRTPEAIARLAKHFIGGTEGWRWRQEMGIDWNAKTGDLVYPFYNDSIGQDRSSVVDNFDASLFTERYRIIDWGKRNPTCCLWIGLLDREWYVYREYYKIGPSPDDFKYEIKRLGRIPFNGRLIEEEYQATFIDPHSDRQNYQGMSSIMHLLNTGENSMNALKANNSDDGISLIDELLYQHRLFIFKDCTNTRWEFKRYRYQDWLPKTQETKNKKEVPIDKDNHAMDCLKYFANFAKHRENLWRDEPRSEWDEYKDQISKILAQEKNKGRWYRGGVIGKR